jgi:hypothetical protein
MKFWFQKSKYEKLKSKIKKHYKNIKNAPLDQKITVFLFIAAFLILIKVTMLNKTYEDQNLMIDRTVCIAGNISNKGDRARKENEFYTLKVLPMHTHLIQGEKNYIGISINTKEDFYINSKTAGIKLTGDNLSDYQVISLNPNKKFNFIVPVILKVTDYKKDLDISLAFKSEICDQKTKECKEITENINYTYPASKDASCINETPYAAIILTAFNR